MVRAVLFDFDGVLADSERLHYEALVHVLSEMGFGLSWDEFKSCLLYTSDAADE